MLNESRPVLCRILSVWITMGVSWLCRANLCWEHGARGGGMLDLGVEESILAVAVLSHYFQVTPGLDSKESGWVIRQRKIAWVNGLSNGLSNRQALTLPRGWWMNELRPPLCSKQDFFPSPPPGFLLQEENGEKQILSLGWVQRGQGAAIPASTSPPHPRDGRGLLQKLATAVPKCKYTCKTFTSIEEKHGIQVRKGTWMRFAV